MASGSGWLEEGDGVFDCTLSVLNSLTDFPRAISMSQSPPISQRLIQSPSFFCLASSRCLCVVQGGPAAALQLQIHDGRVRGAKGLGFDGIP